MLWSWFEIFWPVLLRATSLPFCHTSLSPPANPSETSNDNFYFGSLRVVWMLVFFFWCSWRQGWKRFREMKTSCFIELNSMMVCRNISYLRNILSHTKGYQKPKFNVRANSLFLLYLWKMSHRGARFSGMYCKSVNLSLYFSIFI